MTAPDAQTMGKPQAVQRDRQGRPQQGSGGSLGGPWPGVHGQNWGGAEYSVAAQGPLTDNSWGACGWPPTAREASGTGTSGPRSCRAWWTQDPTLCGRLCCGAWNVAGALVSVFQV